MKISSAEFLVSNSEVAKCPKDRLPEYAFIGRSNVGKSSLINLLTNRKDLAKTSGKPGKTQLINHFLINKNWFLVDLPGYGYAQVSKKSKSVFQAYITDYFLQREQLVAAFVLLDIRLEPQKIDLEFLEWLGINQIPFFMVFTKADKVGPQRAILNAEAYKKVLLESSWEELPEIFITSSVNNTGRDEILKKIQEINASLPK